MVRADAALNHRRLLDAARAALTTADDLDAVSMHAVAQAAGVGQGTLYRHFPTREDLLLAVYETDVQRLIDEADVLLAAHPPGEALRRWLGEVAAYGRLKRGLAQVVRAATGEALARRWRPPVLAALGRLLAAAQTTGEIRREVDGTDVWRLCAFLWDAEAGGEDAALTERRLGVLFDGLATRVDRDPPLA